ncbi:MAG TPA: amidohydrolase family protein [Terriglobia bacterium]|nr:amidohydrolase family protein [Terriglobia bacterium]
MRTCRILFGTALVGALLLTIATKSLPILAAGAGFNSDEDSQSAILEAFAQVKPIDAHAHVFKDDPAFIDLMKRLRLGFLDICVIDDRDPYFKELEPQRNQVLSVVRMSSGQAAFCTTISPYDFEEPGFSQRVVRQLNKDFSDGAVAVKIYKTIGMEIKTKAEKYLMPDDPVFAPIYKAIAERNRTVVAHLAEPDSCWEPPNSASPDYEYYKQHPEEYAYLHPEWPSKTAILAARDHVLAENPKLLMVGAHLGSMETNVDEIAKRFDRYPNFAVDTAARVPYFMLQPRDKVRAFLIKYQDRVLYGTDLEFMQQGKIEDTLKEWKSTYERDWKYFATNQSVEYKGHQVQGLQLPEPVLHKFFHDNAVRWIPGIAGKAK